MNNPLINTKLPLSERLIIKWAQTQYEDKKRQPSREGFEKELKRLRENYKYTFKNFVIHYGANKMIEMKDVGTKINWDVISRNKNDGVLLNLMARTVTDPDDKKELTKRIFERIQENIFTFFADEFEEKVKKKEDEYRCSGTFDYLEV